MPLIRPALVLAGSVLLLSALSACGSGGSDDTATAGDSAAAAGSVPSGAPSGGPGGGAGGGGFPGASGLVADISGKTLQVQGQSGQTAVTYTDTTTFTAQVPAQLSDVEVGSCVQVSSADTGSSGSADQTTPPTAVTASAVRIIDSTDGGCTRGGGPGGPAGGAPSGRPTGLPSDLPTDRPSNGAGGRAGFGGFGAFGEVTAVSATGFTVSQRAFGQNADSGESTEVTVTVSSSTTFTKTEPSTAKALATGKCVTATGDTDDTGAVTAATIAVSDAVDGQCTGGFGGFGGGRQAQGDSQ